MSIFWTCDLEQCGKKHLGLSSDVEIRGFKPHDFGGILLPESALFFQFCSHECCVKWLAQSSELREAQTEDKAKRAREMEQAKEKLKNENFLRKAKPEVIEKCRQVARGEG